MANKIQFRRDTAANWTSTDPVLSQGEFGYETDAGKYKIGDGTSTWSALGYARFPLEVASTSGASQNVNFGATDIHLVELDVEAVELTFSTSSLVSECQLILETTYQEGGDISGAFYDSVSFDVSAQENGSWGLAFNNDGTKMYIVGGSSDNVHQYSLSTAFDVSTASYDSVSFDVSAQETFPEDVTFNNDGTKMYVVGNSSSDSVHQYSLSTAFDVSTASYDSVSFDFSAQGTVPWCVRFNDDGTKMYMSSRFRDFIFQYTLSTAFDVGTASYEKSSIDISVQEGNIAGFDFNSDGTKLWVVGYSSDSVHQYSLSTAFDVSTASYDAVSLDISAQGGSPSNVVFNNDQTKMYIAEVANDNVNQYTVTKGVSLTLPSSAELDQISVPQLNKKSSLKFVSTDSGGSYQLTSKVEDIQ